MSSFSDEHVSVQPTLLQDGRIVYQPTLFALRKDAVQSSVTLKILLEKRKSIALTGRRVSRLMLTSARWITA